MDAIEQAINDLRVGPAFAVADLLVLSPGDWSKLRRAKDTQGRYLIAPDPTAEEASTIFGLPVVATTTCPAGTGLVAAAQVGVQVWIRQGMTVESSPHADGSFTTNRTTFRAEERLARGTPRPSALCKVTGL